jgi:hypothetical protein
VKEIRSCSRNMDVIDQWTRVHHRQATDNRGEIEEKEVDVKKRKREVNMGRVRFRVKVSWKTFN